MSWRRDEIWLDTDLLWLWFRERPGGEGGMSLALHAPAFAGAGQALVIPNGLATSRWRRAELARRRSARRTRAAALVITPAAMLALAAPRLSSGSQTPLLEDPPSLTLRLGAGATPAPAAPARPGSRAARSPLSKAEQLPKIHWREATSHGLPYAGSLAAGTQLPVEGPDWITWNPVADSVPNEPHRLYGHERTIRTVVSVIAAYRAANPGSPRVVVGDISFRGGGPMEAHVSHQNGLDVDVYYPRLDGTLRAPGLPRQIDHKLAQDLLDRFVAVGARMVFVGYSTDLRGPTRVVIPYPNHENHMHVRFAPPRG